MPTLILLDVSLSMARQVERGLENTETRIIDLASKFIRNFIDNLASNCSEEYTSIVAFSSLHEVVVKYTKDFDELKAACNEFVIYDKTIYEKMFVGVENMITEEWGKTVAHNIVLITDGTCGFGDGSLKDLFNDMNNLKAESKFPFPFSFPFHFTVVSLEYHSDSSTTTTLGSKPYFEQLIQMNSGKGEILVPDTLTEVGIKQCCARLISNHYKRFETTLTCGHFQSPVSLSPSPRFQNTYANSLNTYKHIDEEVDMVKLKMATEINIIGFLDLNEFRNPPFVSQHIVVPVKTSTTNSSSNSSKKGGVGKDKELSVNEGQQPSFCVLLHGSLKMEKMGAVVQLSENWFGMLHSWSFDQKKKSNLMLSVFEPGGLPFPWLGDISYLGPSLELPNASNGKTSLELDKSPFPVQPELKQSYQSQSNAVWIKSSGLQSDVQKLLRYARKLPDKQSAFFKEVNKMRRAGIMYGFHNMLFSLADALEKEGEQMKPEVVVQLRHVAEGLRNAPARDVDTNILAINTFRKKSSTAME